MIRSMMLSAGVLALAVAGGVSGAPKQGSGFTGIGSEAASVARAERMFEGEPLAGGTLRADIPRRAVRSNSANRLDQAELAIRKGARSGRRARRVTLGGQKLVLSIVDVNATPYAVLKMPSGLFRGKVAPGASAALATQARALTGCAADSRVYSYGAVPDRPEGIAIALFCG
jgi:hypothetical protein